MGQLAESGPTCVRSEWTHMAQCTLEVLYYTKLDTGCAKEKNRGSFVCLSVFQLPLPQGT